MSFTKVYSKILNDVYVDPEFVSRPRGLEIKEKLCYQFSISNPLDRLPYIKERNYSVSYFVAESLWYLAGISEIDWIVPYSSFWKKISDDGTTANSAYGARIFKPHSYVTPPGHESTTQWDYVINELVSDNDSRRAVIHIRSPFDSYNAKLDVPCTLSLHFMLRDDKIDLIVSMRSSDAILGIGNDIPAFTIMQELMAMQLSNRLGRKIGLGTYRHVSNSMHIYERDYLLVGKILSSQNNVMTWPMPHMPSLPPIDVLLATESKIRGAADNHEMTSHINSVHGKIEPYWFDWVLLLSSHWAAKRGDSSLQQELISSTSFKGYRFFNR